MVESVERHHVSLTIGKYRPMERESPLHITLALGIMRGERMDMVIQKSVELGVAALAPLTTECSGVILEGTRRKQRLQHWRKVAARACEQCGRNRIPGVSAITQLVTWIGENGGERSLLLSPGAHPEIAQTALSAGPMVLLSGPEGGFSALEVELVRRAGFRAVSLGPRTLRADTAPLAALGILQARWGDL